MKLDEAILIATALVEHGTEILTTPEIYALRLSIEALKRIRELRLIRLFGYDTTLAGETKE